MKTTTHFSSDTLYISLLYCFLTIKCLHFNLALPQMPTDQAFAKLDLFSYGTVPALPSHVHQNLLPYMTEMR